MPITDWETILLTVPHFNILNKYFYFQHGPAYFIVVLLQKNSAKQFSICYTIVKLILTEFQNSIDLYSTFCKNFNKMSMCCFKTCLIRENVLHQFYINSKRNYWKVLKADNTDPMLVMLFSGHLDIFPSLWDCFKRFVLYRLWFQPCVSDFVRLGCSVQGTFSLCLPQFRWQNWHFYSWGRSVFVSVLANVFFVNLFVISKTTLVLVRQLGQIQDCLCSYGFVVHCYNFMLTFLLTVIDCTLGWEGRLVQCPGSGLFYNSG